MTALEWAFLVGVPVLAVLAELIFGGPTSGPERFDIF